MCYHRQVFEMDNKAPGLGKRKQAKAEECICDMSGSGRAAHSKLMYNHKMGRKYSY
jgi:hypothetical protein